MIFGLKTFSGKKKFFSKSHTRILLEILLATVLCEWFRSSA